MPIANGSESDANLVGTRYVRVGEIIAYEDHDDQPHAEIASKYFPNQPKDSNDKQIVDDKGEIFVEDKKLHFEGWLTGSVRIKSPTTSRKETLDIARTIWGTERVV